MSSEMLNMDFENKFGIEPYLPRYIEDSLIPRKCAELIIYNKTFSIVCLYCDKVNKYLEDFKVHFLEKHYSNNIEILNCTCESEQSNGNDDSCKPTMPNHIESTIASTSKKECKPLIPIIVTKRKSCSKFEEKFKEYAKKKSDFISKICITDTEVNSFLKQDKFFEDEIKLEEIQEIKMEFDHNKQQKTEEDLVNDNTETLLLEEEEETANQHFFECVVDDCSTEEISNHSNKYYSIIQSHTEFEDDKIIPNNNIKNELTHNVFPTNETELIIEDFEEECNCIDVTCRENDEENKLELIVEEGYSQFLKESENICDDDTDLTEKYIQHNNETEIEYEQEIHIQANSNISAESHNTDYNDADDVDYSIINKEQTNDTEEILSNFSLKNNILEETKTNITSYDTKRKDGMFHCPVCSKMYRRFETLKIHYRNHSGEQNPFKCSVCSKRFSANSKLANHFRVHSNERPFNCHLCPRAFKQSQKLKHHLHSHRKGTIKDRANPYHETAYLPILINNKSINSANTKRHDGLYECPVCNKAYRRFDTLKEHAEVHIEGIEHHCEICNKNFKTLRCLKKHKISIHNYKNKIFDETNISPTTSNSVELHIEKPENIVQNIVVETFQCLKCNLQFKEYDLYLIHSRKHHLVDDNNIIIEYLENDDDIIQQKDL